jgi:hypothetical protein
MLAMQPEDDMLDDWENLIDSIEKTDIPIKFVRNINILFHSPVDNVDEQDIDIARFRTEGWDDTGLDQIVEEVFKEHHNNIKSVHFYVDVKHVSEVVQQQTDLLLKNMPGE